ncbi:MAG: PIN domain-containing protein [Acidobacteria bacterium]|nr:PIN domain-containing protein [Acidobacteriota bacterium]
MTFVDTNILVYRFDDTEPGKHAIATGWLEKLWEERSGKISVQVLRELYSVLTRKVSTPMSRKDAGRIVRSLATWEPVVEDFSLITKGLEIENRWNLSFWDSMVVAAAQRSGSSILLSEDLQNGMELGSVTVVNPFVEQDPGDRIQDSGDRI